MSSTVVTATIVDQAGQAWANGSYEIIFVPNPNLPSANYQWNGANFVPQVYQGVMDNSGFMSVTLPDSNTITPAGSAWAFILCPNATSVCTRVVTPVTGASVDLSALFSARVIVPSIYASPLPRAYTSAEVAPPPPLQGGQFYSVTDNIPYFWTGTDWKALGGTVQSVALTMPTQFQVAGSPVTSNGTLSVYWNNAAAYTVLCNPTGSAALPQFALLNAAMIAQAGTLSNNTTGNAATATTATNATNVTGGYVSKLTAGTGIGLSPAGGTGNVTVSNSGVTQIIAGTGISLSPSGGTGAVTVTNTQTVPSIQVAIDSTGCVIPSGNSYQVASISVTWPSAFPDLNYSVVAIGVGPYDNDPGNVNSARMVCNGVTSKTTTGCTVQFAAVGSNNSSYTRGFNGMYAIAVHA